MDTSASDNPILLKRRSVSENSSAPNSDLYGSSVPRRQSVGVAKPNPARCHGFWVSLLVCGNFSIFLVCSKGYFSENSTDHDKLFYEYILIALMPLVFLNMMACMALRPKDAITHWSAFVATFLTPATRTYICATKIEGFESSSFLANAAFCFATVTLKRICNTSLNILEDTMKTRATTKYANTKYAKNGNEGDGSQTSDCNEKIMLRFTKSLNAYRLEMTPKVYVSTATSILYVCGPTISCLMDDDNLGERVKFCVDEVDSNELMSWFFVVVAFFKLFVIPQLSDQYGIDDILRFDFRTGREGLQILILAMVGVYVSFFFASASVMVRPYETYLNQTVQANTTDVIYLTEREAGFRSIFNGLGLLLLLSVPLVQLAPMDSLKSMRNKLRTLHPAEISPLLRVWIEFLVFTFCLLNLTFLYYTISLEPTEENRTFVEKWRIHSSDLFPFQMVLVAIHFFGQPLPKRGVNKGLVYASFGVFFPCQILGNYFLYSKEIHDEQFRSARFRSCLANTGWSPVIFLIHRWFANSRVNLLHQMTAMAQEQLKDSQKGQPNSKFLAAAKTIVKDNARNKEDAVLTSIVQAKSSALLLMPNGKEIEVLRRELDALKDAVVELGLWSKSTRAVPMIPGTFGSENLNSPFRVLSNLQHGSEKVIDGFELGRDDCDNGRFGSDFRADMEASFSNAEPPGLELADIYHGGTSPNTTTEAATAGKNAETPTRQILSKQVSQKFVNRNVDNWERSRRVRKKIYGELEQDMRIAAASIQCFANSSEGVYREWKSSIDAQKKIIKRAIRRNNKAFKNINEHLHGSCALALSLFPAIVFLYAEPLGCVMRAGGKAAGGYEIGECRLLQNCNFNIAMHFCWVFTFYATFAHAYSSKEIKGKAIQSFVSLDPNHVEFHHLVAIFAGSFAIFHCFATFGLRNSEKFRDNIYNGFELSRMDKFLTSSKSTDLVHSSWLLLALAHSQHSRYLGKYKRVQSCLKPINEFVRRWLQKTTQGAVAAPFRALLLFFSATSFIICAIPIVFENSMSVHAGYVLKNASSFRNISVLAAACFIFSDLTRKRITDKFAAFSVVMYYVLEAWDRRRFGSSYGKTVVFGSLTFLVFWIVIRTKNKAMSLHRRSIDKLNEHSHAVFVVGASTLTAIIYMTSEHIGCLIRHSHDLQVKGVMDRDDNAEACATIYYGTNAIQSQFGYLLILWGTTSLLKSDGDVITTKKIATLSGISTSELVKLVLIGFMGLIGVFLYGVRREGATPKVYQSVLHSVLYVGWFVILVITTVSIEKQYLMRQLDNVKKREGGSDDLEVATKKKEAKVLQRRADDSSDDDSSDSDDSLEDNEDAYHPSSAAMVLNGAL